VNVFYQPVSEFASAAEPVIQSGDPV
jgi:hypothetical protein